MPSRPVVSLCFCFFLSSLLPVISSSNNNVISATHIVFQSSPIIINEYLADPASGDAGDANGDGATNTTQDEFVELVNAGPLALDISGFTISDSAQIMFTIPAGKIIPPGEAAVIFGGGNPTGEFGNAAANGLVFAVGGSGLSLNNGGDSIIVKDNFGLEIATVTYGSAEGNADEAITRSPDITGSFVRHSTAPGSGGARFSPGTRADSRSFVNDDPQINSISPETIIAGAGQAMLIITGDKFQAGAEARVDGNPLSTNFINVTQLTASVPPSITSLPGAHIVTVRNPDSLISNAVTLTVLGAVGINEFLADPPDGPAGDANGDGITSSSQDEFIEVINHHSPDTSISKNLADQFTLLGCSWGAFP